MTDETKTLQEILLADPMISALDAKDALLREAQEFVRGVPSAADGGRDTIGLLVELNAIGRRSRALLLKLNETVK